MSTKAEVKADAQNAALRCDYYVYVWKDALGNVVYVGKGTGNRAYAARNVGGVRIYARDYVVAITDEGLTERVALSIERDKQSQLNVGYKVGSDQADYRSNIRQANAERERKWFDDAYDEDELSSTDLS